MPTCQKPTNDKLNVAPAAAAQQLCLYLVLQHLQMFSRIQLYLDANVFKTHCLASPKSVSLSERMSAVVTFGIRNLGSFIRSLLCLFNI